MDGMDAGSRRVTPSPPSGRSCNPVRENPVILSTRNRMNLEFDEEQGILRQTVREFAEAEIAPQQIENVNIAIGAPAPQPGRFTVD